MDKFYAIDLFSGAGGFAEGILRAGFEIVVSSDINEVAAKTYINRHNKLGYLQGHNTTFLVEDVRNLNKKKIFDSIKNLSDKSINSIKSIDAIFGGPPCQGFSRAGARKQNDPRNLLFKEYLRIVKEIKPKYVVMENVEGFLDTKLVNFIGLNKKYEGKHLLPDLLVSELIQIGYNVLPVKLLNSYDFGVPQTRKRAIFIAYRIDVIKPNYPLPNSLIKTTFGEAIKDLYGFKKSSYAMSLNNGLTPTITGSTLKSKKITNQNYSLHSPLVIERFKLFNEGESIIDLKKRIMRDGIDLSKTLFAKKFDEDTLDNFFKGYVDSDLLDILLTKKRSRVKLDKKEPSKTIMTIADDYINPYSNSVLTVREMARIQSFDDSFEFLGKRTTGGKKRAVETPQQTQVGNAVPPIMAYYIAKEIFEALLKNSKQLID